MSHAYIPEAFAAVFAVLCGDKKVEVNGKGKMPKWYVAFKKFILGLPFPHTHWDEGRSSIGDVIRGRTDGKIDIKSNTLSAWASDAKVKAYTLTQEERQKYVRAFALTLGVAMDKEGNLLKKDGKYLATTNEKGEPIQDSKELIECALNPSYR